MKILSLYSTLLLAQQIPIYKKYVLLTDAADISEIKNLVKNAFARIHYYVTDAEGVRRLDA